VAMFMPGRRFDSSKAQTHRPTVRLTASVDFESKRPMMYIRGTDPPLASRVRIGESTRIAGATVAGFLLRPHRE